MILADFWLALLEEVDDWLFELEERLFELDDRLFELDEDFWLDATELLTELAALLLGLPSVRTVKTGDASELLAERSNAVMV